MRLRRSHFLSFGRLKPFTLSPKPTPSRTRSVWLLAPPDHGLPRPVVFQPSAPLCRMSAGSVLAVDRRDADTAPSLKITTISTLSPFIATAGASPIPSPTPAQQRHRHITAVRDRHQGRLGADAQPLVSARATAPPRQQRLSARFPPAGEPRCSGRRSCRPRGREIRRLTAEARDQ